MRQHRQPAATAKLSSTGKRKYKEKAHLVFKVGLSGAINGARTHDNRNHNPGLYQLSYDRRNTLF